MRRLITVRRFLGLLHVSLIGFALACGIGEGRGLQGCNSHRRNSIEATLRADLYEIRRALDDFQEDKRRSPDNLADLVPHYLRRIPIDPTTRRGDTWRLIHGSGQKGPDVKSGSPATACDGTRYSSW